MKSLAKEKFDLLLIDNYLPIGGANHRYVLYIYIYICMYIYMFIYIYVYIHIYIYSFNAFIYVYFYIRICIYVFIYVNIDVHTYVPRFYSYFDLFFFNGWNVLVLYYWAVLSIFIISMLTLLLMPLTGMHFCVTLNFVSPLL
jgi:hypothetical protein